MSDAPNASTSSPDFTRKLALLKELLGEVCACLPDSAGGPMTADGGGSCHGRSAVTYLQEKAVATGRQVVETVRRHPVEAAAVAVGSGLLVWWWMSRRSTDG